MSNENETKLIVMKIVRLFIDNCDDDFNVFDNIERIIHTHNKIELQSIQNRNTFENNIEYKQHQIEIIIDNITQIIMCDDDDDFNVCDDIDTIIENTMSIV